MVLMIVINYMISFIRWGKGCEMLQKDCAHHHDLLLDQYYREAQGDARR